MDRKKTIIKKLLYKAAAFYAVYFTFLPLINPGIGHWQNVLQSFIVAVPVTLVVYFSAMKKHREEN